MAEHPNATLVREAVDGMMRADEQYLRDRIADDVEWHEIGRSEPIRGKEALAERFASLQGEWNFEGEIHDIVANDEHTIALASVTATIGERSLDYRVAEIYHIRDGKVTHRWAFSDDTARIIEFFG